MTEPPEANQYPTPEQDVADEDLADEIEEELAEEEPITTITNPPKPWWPGDKRVEPFMHPITSALERQGVTGPARTDIYNRAYEAVYQAIVQHADENP